jgi:hypothetical protein
VGVDASIRDGKKLLPRAEHNSKQHNNTTTTTHNF